jgi:hypothetical protein
VVGAGPAGLVLGSGTTETITGGGSSGVAFGDSRGQLTASTAPPIAASRATTARPSTQRRVGGGVNARVAAEARPRA